MSDLSVGTPQGELLLFWDEVGRGLLAVTPDSIQTDPMAAASKILSVGDTATERSSAILGAFSGNEKWSLVQDDFSRFGREIDTLRGMVRNRPDVPAERFAEYVNALSRQATSVRTLAVNFFKCARHALRRGGAGFGYDDAAQAVLPPAERVVDSLRIFFNQSVRMSHNLVPLPVTTKSGGGGAAVVLLIGAGLLAWNYFNKTA